MEKDQPNRVLRCIRRVVSTLESSTEPDQGLLQRFVVQRDEAAFATLMRRHGPMVLCVARRTLQNEHDAEDVFQATFLVLSRKAQTVRRQESLASWLYGVAYRLALKTRATTGQRRHRERRAAAETAATPLAQITVQEAQTILDEELNRLPEKFRAPLVLCCLEGFARDEAAHQIGCPVSVLKSRLGQARERLRQRLLARGLSLPSGLGAFLLLEGAVGANVPQALIAATAKAAMTIAAGGAATAAVSSKVAALVEGTTRAMLAGTTKVVAAFVVVLGILVAGFGIGAHPERAQPNEAPERPVAKQEEAPALVAADLDKTETKDDIPGRTDLYGEALPANAIARLGTLRQRAADAHVAVSADGKDIITVGSALTVRVWSAATGELRSLKQLSHADAQKTFLSPHGKYLLTNSFHPREGQRLIVWDLAAGKLAYALPLPRTAWIEAAAFSSDERHVAIAEASNPQRSHHIRVWDLASGRLRTLHQYEKEYRAFYFDPVVRFSPDGNYLVAVQRDNHMRCWDLRTDKLAWEVQSARTQSQFFCFAPDSKTMIAHGNRQIDVATGKEAPWKGPSGHPLFPVAFSPNGSVLTFLTYQEGFLFWDMAGGKTVLQLKKPSEHKGLIIPNRFPSNIAFTPDSTGFIWRSDVIQRWNLADGKPVFPDTREWGHTEMVSKLVFSPDGKRLASAGRSDRVLLWDIASARPLFTIPGGFNRQLAFMPNGKHLLAPFSDDKIVLGMWDGSTGKVARGLALADLKEFMGSSGNKELRSTADGKKILMLTFKNSRRGDESILTVWDSASGACLRHERVPWSEESVLTPDGESVLALDSVTGDVTLRALDTAQPRWRLPLARIKGLQQSAPDAELCISADGRIFAARVQFYDFATGARSYDDLRIGETATGRQFMKLPLAGPALFEFSADGRLFAVAEADGLRFWEIASQQLAGFLPAHNRHVLPPGHAFASALAFAPDSRTFATGHTDSTILLWDATFRKDVRRALVSDAERNVLWIDLAGVDAVAAQAAFWRLVDDPKLSAAFLRERLKPVTAVPPEVMRPLLRDLGSDQFKVRVAAEQQLRALGERAEPALREAAKSSASLETTRRVEAMLATSDSTGPLVGETLRGMRSVQILERIGSPESRRTLEELTQGVASARLTRAAKESLERMRKR